MAEGWQTTLSPSLEDYLEELYRLSLAAECVRVTDISNKLNVKLPSVTKALQKLRDLDYVCYQPYGEIALTEKGKTTGDFLVTRNKVLQEFLKLICSQCDFAAEAEAIEHYLSRATIFAITNFVAFATQNSEWYQEFLNYVK